MDNNTQPLNLLFDLGGVIMDISRDNCVKAFRDLGMADVDNLLGEYVQKGVFSQIESGLITPGEFRAEIRRYLPGNPDDRTLDNAFEKFLTEIPIKRLQALRRLRHRHRIYMLSNTNPIMWNGRIDSEFRKEGLTMSDYFDGTVTSFEAKAMKPDPAIFEYAIRKIAIEPGQTLFLDDSRANLDTAAKFGFRTALVAPGEEFTDILDRLNI